MSDIASSVPVVYGTLFERSERCISLENKNVPGLSLDKRQESFNNEITVRAQLSITLPESAKSFE